jgi:hypothetical protein
VKKTREVFKSKLRVKKLKKINLEHLLMLVIKHWENIWMKKKCLMLQNIVSLEWPNPLLIRARTARSIFTKYAIPETFPDGT